MTTMSGMQHEAHTLTGAYVLDALEPAERAAFEEHLEVCAACRQEVAELLEVTAVLGGSVAVSPPETLKAAVDARVAITRQQPPKVTPITAATSRIRKHGRQNRATWAGWIAAAALAGVVAGQAVYDASQQHRIDSVSQQADAMAQLLSAPDVYTGSRSVANGGTATVVVSRSRDEAAIALAGLAAPPAGKAYQLWMISPAGVRSGGVVTLANGASGAILAHGLDGAMTVGLTVEPAHGSVQPTTKPVVLLPMS